MKKNIFLGIDTSNYTTSIAAVSDDGEVIANIKRLLPVAQGERGLRQSDAVFAHIKALPELSRELSNELDAYVSSDQRNFTALSYSAAPRDVQGSYMPCFLVGEAVASFFSSVMNAPLLSSSHQAGHIMAALYSSRSLDLIGKTFAAFHVSGGTTDLLLCEPDEENVFRITEIGGSRDINAGQAIDRAGVVMGMKFPCGPELEKAAKTFDGKKQRVKISVNGLYCNLSGLENKANELFERTSNIEETASFVFEFVSETLYAMSSNLRKIYPDIPIVYAGGVMSSSIIKDKLSEFGSRYAEPRFSSDNAAGCALLCRKKYLRSLKKEV